MNKTKLWMLAAILSICGTIAQAQTKRSDDFHAKYELKEVVVMSRHNIRSPLSSGGAAYQRVTPHTWFTWSSPSSQLSLRGGVLETEMGQFFRQWVVNEGLLPDNYRPKGDEVLFYANSRQRTFATAKYFSAGFLPFANVEITHKLDEDKMDPVFTPQFTKMNDTYRQQVLREIEAMNGGVQAWMAAQQSTLTLMEEVLDMAHSPAALQGDTTHFWFEDTQFKIEKGSEPKMTGGYTLANSVADALVLQCYESESFAPFGHELTMEQWRAICAVKEVYDGLLFTAHTAAINLAYPLVSRIREELNRSDRKFMFLCGHDSNLASIGAALGLQFPETENALERHTPIGSKLVFEKWSDGTDEYVAVNLVYQAVSQLQGRTLLLLNVPPMVLPIAIEGLVANGDGLYRLNDLDARMANAMAEYEAIEDMPTAVSSASLSEAAQSKFVTVKDGHFVKDGKPYYYVGANFWYGAILGSEGQGGNRMRLIKELDYMKKIGIDNLRILVGSDGERGVTTKVEPTLQVRPGVYNDTILAGLDFLLQEMGKRGMVAVLYLNNSWEWSGGYGFYLEHAGAGKQPRPNEDGYPAYMQAMSKFATNKQAHALFYDYVRFILSRTNRYTGLKYADDPAIMSWQIGNEPRAFDKAVLPDFEQWLAEASALIRSLDSNHLISVGSEGSWGCENDWDSYERICKDKNIDYCNIHLWPYNWSWARQDHLIEDLPKAKANTKDYIDRHLEICARLRKPLVMEEFGYPRDDFKFALGTSTKGRDGFYQYVFSLVADNAEQGGFFAGCNFWGWGGFAKPQHEQQWQVGDDYTGDPAQEQQGLNSVFSGDKSTLKVIKSQVDRMKKLR